jgi:hypothetical protein
MCNGWKNRETWLANIWFGDTFAMMQDDGVRITPDFIQGEVEAYIEENVGSHNFITDMMDLGAIDYDALAAHYAPELEVVGGPGDAD